MRVGDARIYRRPWRQAEGDGERWAPGWPDGEGWFAARLAGGWHQELIINSVDPKASVQIYTGAEGANYVSSIKFGDETEIVGKKKLRRFWLSCL
jgi:hypothetical protein